MVTLTAIVKTVGCSCFESNEATCKCDWKATECSIVVQRHRNAFGGWCLPEWSANTMARTDFVWHSQYACSHCLAIHCIPGEPGPRSFDPFQITAAAPCRQTVAALYCLLDDLADAVAAPAPLHCASVCVCVCARCVSPVQPEAPPGAAGGGAAPAPTLGDRPER